MKCKSCKEDVPPKFVHAISVNVCPLCGREIMDSELQSILNDLKTIMDKASGYTSEVADWLFSNYGLKKWDPKEAAKEAYFSGGIEPTVGHPKSQPAPPGQNRAPVLVHRSEDEDMEVESPGEDVSVFAKRAGLKPSNFKKVIANIQNAGAADPSEFQGVDDEYGEINVADEEPSAPLDSRGKKEIMAIFKEDGAKSLELEKLKKLRAQNAVAGAGGGGKFWRS
jgi:hypothetical protein